MIETRPSAEIDREQVPEPHNTFDRPWVYYTYNVPPDTICAKADCGLYAHIGLMELDDDNVSIWEGQEEDITGDMTYWCAIDYSGAIVQQETPTEPQTEEEVPREMTEEQMMMEWGGEDAGNRDERSGLELGEAQPD